MFRALLIGLIFLSTLGLSGCMSPPVGLDVARARTTAQQHYQVEIKPVAEPIVIGKMHSWEVSVKQASGQPLAGAKILIDGGMPQHHHGLPTQPRMTRELGEGRYLVEGVKFSMSGWWEFKLKIEGAQGVDNVTFNLVLP